MTMHNQGAKRLLYEYMGIQVCFGPSNPKPYVTQYSSCHFLFHCPHITPITLTLPNEYLNALGLGFGVKFAWIGGVLGYTGVLLG